MSLSEDGQEVPFEPKLIIGLSSPEYKDDASMALDRARRDGFNFVTTSLSSGWTMNNKASSGRGGGGQMTDDDAVMSGGGGGGGGGSNSSAPNIRTDVLALDAMTWSRCVVGQLDKNDTMMTNNNNNNMDDIEWAHHMNIPAVILPEIPSSRVHGDDGLHNYAAELARQAHKAHALTSFQLWVPVKLASHSIQDWQIVYRMCGQNHHIGAILIFDAPTTQPSSTSTMNVDGNLSGGAGDGMSDEEEQLLRNPANFLAYNMRLLHIAIGTAPIRALSIPTNVFLTNKRGYPTLSRNHQTLFCEILKRIGRTLRFVIQGPSCHSHLMSATGSVAGGDGAAAENENNPAGASGCLPYLQYLNYLRSKKEVTDVLNTPEAMMECNDDDNYLDALQRPLQPLRDHLENRTYATFEKDPIKYSQYQNAVGLALRDKYLQIPPDQQPDTEFVVCVAGSGRGPLVTGVLQAYTFLQQQGFDATIAVYAIEKNPSAITYLQAKADQDPLWSNVGVKIVCRDMRHVKLDDLDGKQCDIVVSELLGSFGDNELSPECLDAFFQTDVCKSNTISIPRQYTSHLTLVSSAELHLQAQNQALYPNDTESDVIGAQKAMETPYVVRTHAASQTHEEQDCWGFAHPSPDNNYDHTRMAALDFAPHHTSGAGFGSGYGPRDTIVEQTASNNQSHIPPSPWTLTGLLGTFTADLYSCQNKDGSMEGYQISTSPKQFSIGMFSWFPLYFPLREPVHVPCGANVRVYMWRRVDELTNKVWYEWSVAVHRNGELLSVTPIHNPGGRSSNVSM